MAAGDGRGPCWSSGYRPHRPYPTPPCLLRFLVANSAATILASIAQCVCGFSTMDNIALLNLEGMGMAGHPGVAAKLFGALQRVGISVILISQVRCAVGQL